NKKPQQYSRTIVLFVPMTVCLQSLKPACSGREPAAEVAVRNLGRGHVRGEGIASSAVPNRSTAACALLMDRTPERQHLLSKQRNVAIYRCVGADRIVPPAKVHPSFRMLILRHANRPKAHHFSLSNRFARIT